MSTAKSIIISSGLVISIPAIVPICAGMAGTKYFLVANTATIEGIPNMIAVLIFTKPCLYLGQAPTKLLAPTINKE